MFLYSLLFAAVYFGGVTAFALWTMTRPDSEEHHAASVGHALIFVGASLSAWIFARRYKRLFTVSETWRVIAFCIGWVYVLEAVAFRTHIDDIFSRLSAFALFGVLVYSLGLDAFLVWLAFRIGRRAMTKYLEKQAPNAV